MDPIYRSCKTIFVPKDVEPNSQKIKDPYSWKEDTLNSEHKNYVYEHWIVESATLCAFVEAVRKISIVDNHAFPSFLFITKL